MARVPDPDTIAALATAPGRGPIGIIRVSGPDAVDIAARLFQGSRDPRTMPGFTLAHGWVVEAGERLDEVLLLVMRGPRSYTREDVVEFHCHGGPATTRGVLAAALRAGARPAQPGEFTRRAFLSGRLDLAQAEAVSDLVQSETEAAARAARVQLEGGLSDRLGQLRQGLLELLARVEAGIDFPEEEHVTAVEPTELEAALKRADSELASLLAGAERGQRLRQGARVVIAGRPNVGKSTLMNALLGVERVIVTPVPGATRDVVEDAIELDGILVRLFDTAGLRDDPDPIERLGIVRARAAVAGADLVLLVVDGSAPLGPEDKDVAGAIAAPLLLVKNKCDLGVAVPDPEVQALAPGAGLVSVSALTGQGLPALEAAMSSFLAGGTPSAETPLVTSLRHAQALETARAAVRRARAAGPAGAPPEFTAADLRRALEALGEVTGETAADEVLDLIFSRFCIGK